MPITVVVPTLLQMDWIEFTPKTFTVSKIGRDKEEQYVETPVGSLAPHKFVKLN